MPSMDSETAPLAPDSNNTTTATTTDSRLHQVALLVEQHQDDHPPATQPTDAPHEIAINEAHASQASNTTQTGPRLFCSIVRTCESFNSVVLLFYLATTIGLIVTLALDKHRPCAAPLKTWATVQIVCQVLVIMCLLFYQYRLLAPSARCGLYFVFWISRLLHLFLFCWMIVGIVWLAEAAGIEPEACSSTTPHIFKMTIVVLSSEAVAVLVLVLLALCCFSFVFLLCGMYALFVLRSTPQGASYTRINKLPKVLFEQATAPDATCSICYSDYCAGDEMRVLPCKHSFHCHCVDEWLAINKTCPLCRRDIDIDNADAAVDAAAQPLTAMHTQEV